jgi:hypothetical protein
MWEPATGAWGAAVVLPRDAGRGGGGGRQAPLQQQARGKEQKEAKAKAKKGGAEEKPAAKRAAAPVRRRDWEEQEEQEEGLEDESDEGGGGVGAGARRRPRTSNETASSDWRASGESEDEELSGEEGPATSDLEVMDGAAAEAGEVAGGAGLAAGRPRRPARVRGRGRRRGWSGGSSGGSSGGEQSAGEVDDADSEERGPEQEEEAWEFEAYEVRHKGWGPRLPAAAGPPAARALRSLGSPSPTPAQSAMPRAPARAAPPWACPDCAPGGGPARHSPPQVPSDLAADTFSRLLGGAALPVDEGEWMKRGPALLTQRFLELRQGLTEAQVGRRGARTAGGTGAHEGGLLHRRRDGLAAHQ